MEVCPGRLFWVSWQAVLGVLAGCFGFSGRLCGCRDTVLGRCREVIPECYGSLWSCQEALRSSSEVSGEVQGRSPREAQGSRRLKEVSGEL